MVCASFVGPILYKSSESDGLFAVFGAQFLVGALRWKVPNRGLQTRGSRWHQDRAIVERDDFIRGQRAGAVFINQIVLRAPRVSFGQ